MACIPILSVLRIARCDERISIDARPGCGEQAHEKYKSEEYHA
jgi:hypothetical protein